MSEMISKNEVAPKTDRWKSVVLVLTLINTVFATLLSGLQVDAGIRADTANRDSQYYVTLVSSELVHQGYQSSYDFQTFAVSLKASQESLIAEFTAFGLEQKGDQKSAENFRTQSAIAKAQADTARKFSVLYTDPRYAPAQPDDMPQADAYLIDMTKVANDLLIKQNAASDLYQVWNKKADAYAAVLTLLAIIFFLLGVAQSAQRMRPFFAISASVIMLIASAWTFLILIK
ncbi:MAG: hypothetical protein IPP66_19840 [Anaerolineales bacterium]|nr:hypothetical protein [Anaerolineales bacterium]